MESSRLPRVVDEWVVNQIHAGKSPEEIRRMLTVSDEVKAEVRKSRTYACASQQDGQGTYTGIHADVSSLY
jgi:hypothetical protein